MSILSLSLSLALLAAPSAVATEPAPAIDGEVVSHLTPTDATLEAQINPRSTGRGAYYQFQVVTDPAEYRGEFTCATEGWPANSSLCVTVPSQAGALPIDAIGPRTEDKLVSLDLAQAGMELQPNTTYHWRVITAGVVQTIDTIEWEEPITHGTSMTFTTPAEGSSPTIESEAVSNLAPSDATLEAVINPEGSEGSYEFHLEEQHACEESFPPCEMPKTEIPLPGGQLPAFSAGQHLSLDLNSAGVTLVPNRQYAYWVSAANSAGSVSGTARKFTAPLPAEEPESEPTPPLSPLPSSEGQGQSPPKAKPCRRAPRHHRAKRHRHRRAGVDKACHPA